MAEFTTLSSAQIQRIRVSRQRTEPRFFLDRFYKRKVFSTNKAGILVEELPENGRKLAPFSSPMLAGRPVAGNKSRVSIIKPAYLKHTTPVIPGGQVVVSGDAFGVLNSDPNLEHARERGRIVVEHSNRIERTWEFMAAFAAINGYIDTSYEGVPEARIDFGRANNLTVVKSAGTFWGDPNISILDDTQDYKRRVSDAENGGSIGFMLVGSKVANLMVKQARKDGELHELLDTRYGADSAFLRGLRGDEPVQYIGRLSNMVDVYEYDVAYQTLDNDGNVVTVRPLLPNQIALIGKDFEGVQGFGRIEDLGANYAAVDMFGRNFVTASSPSHEFVDHQSAPVMIPCETNKTLVATVMAP